jgi:hypothetical protein
MRNGSLEGPRPGVAVPHVAEAAPCFWHGLSPLFAAPI